jgi:hypothetical protein
VSERICLACPRPIDPSRRADAKVCNDGACRTWAQRHPDGPKRPFGLQNYTCENPECGEPFTRPEVRGKRPRFCGDRCREGFRKFRDPDRWRRRDLENARRLLRESAARNKDKRRAYRLEHMDRERVYGRDCAQRRRARKTTTSVEVFTHLEIFERDDWVCQICNKCVPPWLRHPHPQSASLDHIVPLARGGTHTRDNVQLAHLRCNLRKHARLLI